MRDFSYLRADTIEAARNASALPGAMLLAGGTALVDLAKCGVAEPSAVIDLSHIDWLSASRPLRRERRRCWGSRRSGRGCR